MHTPDLFEYYRQTGKLPTTSAPTPAYYEEFYQKWTDEGYDIVHLSISGEMTVTPNIARMAVSYTHLSATPLTRTRPTSPRSWP